MWWSHLHGKLGRCLSYMVAGVAPLRAMCAAASIGNSTRRLVPRGKGMFEMFNLDLKVGGVMKIKGHISEDAEGFAINLGCKSSDLALHFNPRFNESVIVCNSLCSDNWQQEQRDKHFSFYKGSTVKLIIEFLGDKFLVKLPDGHEVEFPNRHSYDKISYLNIHGGFKVTSFKVE
ncbi:galectin-2 isoform X1 [Numida meleagris]|uniref:galectin-2 isoform X1 n=2 Tax=Numida meleagris TaxID=8996 RepID=UPI000B3DCF75|nr:galectin-2 isoform X1 [Numida meleagris]